MVGAAAALWSAVLALTAVWLYLRNCTSRHYWGARGVPVLTPSLPLLGNMYDLLLLRSLPDIVDRIYRQSKGLPFVGIYAFHTPVLFVLDLNLCARILINDFSHFVDRGFHYNENDVIGRNLIHQSETEWRGFRPKLSAAYNMTKVKTMFDSMVGKSVSLLERIESERAVNEVVDAWDVSLRYNTDVLTLSIMGAEAKCLETQNGEFLETGKRILGFHFIYHVLLGCFCPKLHKFLNIPVAVSQVTEFFTTVLQQVIGHRRNSNFIRKDLIHTLMELKKDTKYNGQGRWVPEVDDNFIIAQSFGFFMAGVESPGGTIACTLYELAKNPLIQETLSKEINHVLEKNDGQITFDSIQAMKYLQQVISESLRKYPPLALIFRRCTKQYAIPGTSNVIEKGTLVFIPLKNIHYDASFYPDPEYFDPERFSDENSAERHNAAYMPFGVGPRLCPAVLYSLVKIKAALVHIFLQYEVGLAKETPAYLQASPLKFLFTPKNGIPLTFKRRTHQGN